jgi:protein-tyrosine phosphatase
VLFVCTGNICRSPLAEQLFRMHMEASRLGVTASSAGTGVRAGEPMTAQAAALSLGYGGDPSSHRAMPIDSVLIRESSLILTATRTHRAEVVSLVPRASRYTFTLREFARLVERSTTLDTAVESVPRTVEPFDLDEFVRQAASRRGHGPIMMSAADDDIPDPYLREQSVYDEVGVLVHDAVADIARAIAGSDSSVPLRGSAES